MKKTGFLVLLAMSFSLTASAARLTGTVTDSFTGEPLVSARVELVGTSLGSTTDQDGRYFFRNLAPGIYEIRVIIIGYATATDTADVVDDTSVQDFRLMSSVPGMITGTITDADSELPIEGATVTVDEGFATAESSDEGLYLIAGVTPREYALYVSATGYADDSDEVFVDAGEIVIADFALVPLDSDSDGLPDLVETNTGVFVSSLDTGTDPNLSDSDGDGLDDGDEVITHTTDPTDPDTDGDGLTDGDEINVHGTVPTDPDSDDDGYTDSDEVDNETDPNSSSSLPPDNDGDFLSDLNDPDDDNDGLADEVETGTGTFVDETDTGTDSLDPDTDDDGLPDGDEVGVHSTDPNNADTDDDGLTDGDEIDVHGTVPTDPDSDDDGYTDSDEVDNETDPNSSSSLPPDNDGDFLSDMNDPDDDNDGLADEVETGTGTFVDETDTGTDSLDPDTDDDGLPDGDEVNSHQTDPNNADTDDDTMPDGWEISHDLDPVHDDTEADPDDDGLVNRQEYVWGTDPHDADTDGDTFTDGDEVAHGSDPLVNDDAPEPWLTSITIEPQDAHVWTDTPFTFYATGEMQNGSTADLDTATVVWSVISGPGTIDPDTGVFSADMEGQVEIFVEVSLEGITQTDRFRFAVETSFSPGDIDRNRSVDAVDVQLVINRVLGLDILWNADINGDETIDAVDVQLVINAALGINITDVLFGAR